MSVTLLTQAETAKMLRCSKAKVARERYLGRLAYVPGRPVLIRLEDILEWLDRRRVAAQGTETDKNYNPVRAARRAVLRKRANTKGNTSR